MHSEQPYKFITGTDNWYKGVLKDVKRSETVLQPVFEAFTNALEAIDLRKDKSGNGNITIEIISSPTTVPDQYLFQQLRINDDGIGFDDENFDRLKMYKDDRKGNSNKGSGRL